MFSGSIVALATPFKGGNVDLQTIESLVEFHVARGTSGIVPCGTTGEAATLSIEERRSVVSTAIKAARGRVPIIPGTGTNSTTSSIELTAMAKELGADGALLVTPYYNKPPQEGLYRHFRAVAEAVDLPIVLYNVPGRTAVNMLAETTIRLSKVKNIVAIKEASGNLDQIKHIKNSCDIAILSGDDAMIYPVMQIGGVGVISVAANVIPAEVAAMCSSIGEAKRGHERYAELFKTLFIETNPIPVKTAMSLMGLCGGEFRLPLCEISADKGQILHDVLKRYSLIQQGAS